MREETERLQFRDFEEADIERTVAFFSEEAAQPNILADQRLPSVIRRRHRRLVEITKAFDYSERVGLCYSVVEKSSGEFIGVCGVGIALDDSNGKLGWHFSSEYAGQGYATEAAKKLIQIGFEVNKAPKIRADCFKLNIAGTRVLEKAGMVPVQQSRFDQLKMQIYYAKRKPVVRYEMTLNSYRQGVSKNSD